ncbi:MAG: HAMP domain-containing histidine kinase [Lachnospiraceae bacterium]|nr:HAMP domain-containing histidine kinase [Lachnospiraceae bacterium]
MFRYTEYNLLNKMLDDAISGEFEEKNFDESELSKLQSKLMRYLTTSSISEKKLREEKENIEELITNISHQTKTPLTNIMMYSELLGEKADGELKEYAEEIHSQSRKLEDLITALVKMSRLETGIFRLQPEANSLMTVLKRAYDQALPKAKLKNIELILSEGTDAKANIDLKWTTEAVFNIIDNAIKYSGEGTGIKLKINTFEMFSSISVEDHGIGIEEEEIPKLFARFYRSRQVSDNEGIGVGLYLARQLAEEQGGYIKVKSAPGKGSTFELFFPNVSKL